MQKKHCPYDAVWTAFAVVVLSLVFAVGCSSEAERPPSLGNSGDRGTAGVQTGPCKDGWQRHCSETLDQEDGVLSCWEGTQYCENGRWSACLDGELTHRPDPTAKANRPYIGTLSISSAPVACLNNPCDPTCMWWDEDPSPDLAPTGVVSGNPTYSGLPAASVCSHDICSTGAALDATCSACVTTVCSNASYASCCDSSVSNAWNQTCVDAAYTLCLGQPPPLGLCDFGLYATGSVVGADRASAGVAIGSNTSVTLGVDSSPSRILVNGNLSIANGNGNPIVAPNGIIATGNISVAAGNSKITGTVQAGGSVALNSGVTVTGNVWARTNITGQATGTINGTGYAGGTVDPVLTVTSRVNGSTHAAPVVTVPTTIPTKTVTCSTNAADNRSVSGSTSVLTLPPGNYNTVSVSNDATLVLSAEGTYTFNSLSVNTGKIRLGAAFTTVGYDVDVCNGFTLRGQSSYNEIQDSTGALLTTATALRIYVNGSGAAVDMGPDVQFVGVLRAPNGSVTKGDRGTIKGAIWSKSMSLGTDQYATGINEAECDALNLGGDEPVVACPGQNTTPAVPPALNEPCNTGLDCQMNNRCVEPRTVGGSHSKCLEGSALSASQGDACVAKICAADPTCCSTAWTPACVAKVATVCDAVCGAPSGCLHQACTTGSPLQTTCDSCINTICSNAATAYCCSTTWDATCVAAAYSQCGGGLTPDRAVPGVSLCDYAGYAKGSATALATLGTGLEATVTGGTFGGLGAVNLTNAKIYGDAFAVGSFAINTVTITGKTYSESTSAPTVTALTGSAPIYPVTIPRPTTPTISWGTAPYSCPGGSAASGSPAPGNFGATTVAAGNTLTLSAGTYTFSSLTVNGTLALPTTGQVKLIVCGTVTFGTGGKMTGLTDATALNLEIYAQNNVSLKSGTKLYGFVFSSTDITIDQDTTSPTTVGTTLKGMALSNSTINVKTKSKLDYDNLRSTCISKGFGTNPSSSVSSPERLCSYSTYGTTSVVTAGNQYIRGGNLGSAGTVSLGNATSRTTVDGNLFARGNVTLTGAAVLGDVRTTGTISSSGTTTVYGTQTPPGTDKVPNPTAIPNPTFTCGSSAQTFNGTTGSIAPGSYGALSMANWANVTLSAGTYYFSSVDVQSNAKFTLPTTGVV